MRIRIGTIVGCWLLFASLVQAETKRFELSAHNSHYSYRLPAQGPGIDGCDPYAYQCDFLLSGTVDIQIAADLSQAMIGSLDVQLVGNEPVLTLLPSAEDVAELLEGHELPLSRMTEDFRQYAGVALPYSKFTLWLSEPGSRSLLFEGAKDEAMLEGPASLFLFLALEVPALRGDYNYDGVLNVGDLDRLAWETREAQRASIFDLNRDTLTTTADVRVWVHDLMNTWMGDANLNGLFGTDDLVEVFQAGKYETGLAATWGSGDWDSDGLFNSSDFVLVLQEGGYEAGPRLSSTALVPEPRAVLPLVAWLVVLHHSAYRRWRRRHQR